ncbi:MAG: glycosyltransferase [Proteobacteria bacterium]|nr:glycosyltransferase [Pseudomonadota bacterium]NDC24739.1 glycosyltransferase [Pseudomonadota bacterium]NDD04901.1 glycosyltransferase [Pseudomonadota bacterium]NDG27296.1 glycosyltransferase [Pseudomonadota bacterium]
MMFSLLILTYNRFSELSHCLNSLQTEQENLLEIIVLDNGSSPPLKEMDFQLFQKVSIVRSEENRGVAAGRNKLARRAKFPGD